MDPEEREINDSGDYNQAEGTGNKMPRKMFLKSIYKCYTRFHKTSYHDVPFLDIQDIPQVNHYSRPNSQKSKQPDHFATKRASKEDARQK